MSRACVWLANGHYLYEAAQSAARVAACMPELSRHLFTPEDFSGHSFTHLVRLNPHRDRHWYLCSIRYMLEALSNLPEEILFLDSDVYMIDPVPELFELLTQFDFAGMHAPGRITGRTVGSIPQCFPEWNIGVLVMRNNPKVRELWVNVLDQYETHQDIYGNNDQPPLREVLWCRRPYGLTTTTFTAEYNCRFTYGTFVSGRVKMLHGRSHDYEQIARSLNVTGRGSDAHLPCTSMRVWRPDAHAEPSGDREKESFASMTYFDENRRT